MNGTIKFFHPEDTFVYHIEKCFCKVVFSNNHNNLVIEIESNEDLDHVEEDSLQNEFPKVTFNIDDYFIDVASKQELVGKKFSIPNGTIEGENEEGESVDIFLTNLNANEEDDFETNENELVFSEENGHTHLNWKGKVDDFTEQSNDLILFEIDCLFAPKKLEVID